MRSHKQPLMLGKTILTEESLIKNRVYLDRILKRKGDDEDDDGGADAEGGKETKKARIERSNGDGGLANSGTNNNSNSSNGRGSGVGSGSKIGTPRGGKGGGNDKRAREDEDFYNNENTVRPENVLRMVDSSLVDTPEKGNPNREEYNENVYVDES